MPATTVSPQTLLVEEQRARKYLVEAKLGVALECLKQVSLLVSGTSEIDKKLLLQQTMNLIQRLVTMF